MGILKGLGIVLAVMIIAAIGYGSWQLGRKINYTMSYEDMVKQTVKYMVKDECLKK